MGKERNYEMKLTKFKTWTVGLVAALALSTTASAADIPTYPSPDSVVVSNNGVDWTGFYAGLLVGYGWGDQDHDINFFGADTSDAENFLSHEPKGFLFGGTIGVNYHVPGSRVVVGLEGDWSFANHDDRNEHSLPDWMKNEILYSETEVNSIGTARLRAGYLVNPNTLFYGTGGLAWASVNTKVGFDDTDNNATPADDHSFVLLEEEDTNVGWTIGGGVEYKIDSIWSVKAEYLYVDLADTEHSALAGNIKVTDDLTEHMVRVGVNATLF